MTELNIDGTNCILGRLCSYAAKQALIGNTINIFNCEKIIVSGDPKKIKERYRHTLTEKGQPHKGPYIPRMPDRFVRKVIKGMLPHTSARGRAALKRVMCYIEVPEEFKEKKIEQIKTLSADKLPTLKRCTIKEICRHLGGKI
ncbi:MAG TPA: 50S ribosomal protein L13 [Candidatus Woesearchaeota archaeon]|nr:MAG: 50S ribosomal protein L13 [Candidatus Woesearchaeota archaeon]HDD70583.1 50S ribosomal protein L13 [Candidatus Woesearchaeota archaeon]